VIVGPGLHQAGGRAAPGAVLANRACVDRAITLVSAEGPEVTIIAGAAATMKFQYWRMMRDE
jgi:hypothetical protein